jgi:hypothetical protein
VHDAWPYILLGLLGAYHGINPAMGWLFAVALGMQERSRRAVLRSLVPIAIGHELSIVLVAVLVVGLGLVADTHHLHLAAGVGLIAFGIFRFVRPHAHFRWGAKMQVNRRELGWWSFLMSTAHGAGLMVAPVIIGAGSTGTAAAATDEDVHHVNLAIVNPLGGGLALLLHLASMLAVMAIVAVVVYEKLGVRILRQAWLNTEWLWSGTFVLAGMVTIFN